MVRPLPASFQEMIAPMFAPSSSMARVFNKKAGILRARFRYVDGRLLGGKTVVADILNSNVLFSSGNIFCNAKWYVNCPFRFRTLKQAF